MSIGIELRDIKTVLAVGIVHCFGTFILPQEYDNKNSILSIFTAWGCYKLFFTMMNLFLVHSKDV